MEQNAAGASFCQSFIRPYPVGVHTPGLFFLMDLEFVVHYYLGITIVYTQFYLIVVIAGLWYGRRAVWVALLFNSLNITVTLCSPGCSPGMP